jgi:SNF2 family DNA or RNA helicase
VANRPYDIWAQIWFLDQGKSLGNEFDMFKSSTDLRNDLYDNEEGQKRLEGSLDIIFNKIRGFTVRETKDSGIIRLPRKEYHTIFTEWETRQHELYCRVRDELRAVVIRDGLPAEDRADDLLKRLLRLVQISSNPRLVDESYREQPGKYEYLFDVIASIRDRKEKAIIWTNFVDNVNWLKDELKPIGVAMIHGNMAIADRTKSIERFIRDESVPLLVATPGAGKEGLTLTVANHVIFYDRGFSLDDYLQAQDRIHRISQEKTCHIYLLIMKESIDEWVDVLLQSKQLAAKISQGDISLEYYKQHISYEFGAIIKRMLNINEKRQKEGGKNGE